MAGNDHGDELEAYLLRIPKPLKAMVKLYADSRALSMNLAIRELLETHPSMTGLYRRLTSNAEYPPATTLSSDPPS